MADVFQRHLGAVLALDPGQWCSTDGRISIRCKSCGSIDTIKGDVDPAGRVAHRYTCLTVTCGYQSYLLLEAW